MKVLVLGATGGTGLQLVKRALSSGHHVTALVRNADALQEYAGQMTITTGDPLDRAQLRNVLREQDAVLSGLGPRVPVAKSDAHLLRTFATSLSSYGRNGSATFGDHFFCFSIQGCARSSYIFAREAYVPIRRERHHRPRANRSSERYRLDNCSPATIDRSKLQRELS